MIFIYKFKKITLAIFVSFILCFFSVCGNDVNVEYLGVFGESRMNSVLGQDGVAPIPFDDKVTLWTFGDTILGSWKGDVSAGATFSERTIIKNMLSNSLAFTGPLSKDTIQKLDFSYYREKGRITPCIKYLPGEDPYRVRLWALDGIRLGNKVYVYYTRIRITDPEKPLAFEIDGTGIAEWIIPSSWKPGDPVRFTRKGLIFTGNEPVFGGSVINKDGYLYTTGQYSTKEMKSYIRIARVPHGSVGDRNTYRFLAPGGRWTSDINSAHSLLGDVSGECTLSYNESLKEYIIIYCRLWKGDVSMVRFREFTELDSPAVKTVFTPPPISGEGKPSTHFYYSGKEIFSDGRIIYAIYMNPLDYQPYLIKIKL